ncbi:MAG: DNA-directed RNA polymerase subunit beta' [Rhodoluna sp.]
MMDIETFSSLRIGLATSDDIRSWSNGEVKKPETINYRTLKPEKDGLFCEKIFGPTKDWECSCGKYKRVRFKDIVCERCGVQVTKSSVRRERMGHIELAAPVTHIWYFKGVPSRLGYLLNMAPKDLEKIIYFAAYRVMEVDEAAKKMDWVLIKDDYITRIKQTLHDRYEEMVEAAQEEYDFLIEQGLDLQIAVKIWEAPTWVDHQFVKTIEQMIKMEVDDPKNFFDKPFTAAIAEGKEAISREAAAQKVINQKINEFRKKTEKIVREYARLERPDSLQKEQLSWRQFLTAEEGQLIQNDVLFDYFDYFYGDYVITEIGALAIQQVLAEFDLQAAADELKKEIADNKGSKQTQAIKRLKVVSSFLQSNTPATSMVLDVLPVLPPEIRPMVQLDGGRFATSDLNDLYRRVINRNNRLKRFVDLGAVPKTILNNEKRMLQEAVDALFDNGRRGRPVTGTGNRPLKSLSDLLKGKQGRFRQNLLGKRVDYSGRSVIVVGPQLKMHQCGLPKLMALELFKPFVMKRLVDQGIAMNIKSAKRMVERSRTQVWDVLEEVIRERPVLLNRAPTLHRLGIQAFEPLLVEGKAIQLHPLVCAAFNADFDGDQMAVHLPLSAEAQAEARLLMLASNNILKPSDGKPVATPSQDMIIGLYFMTTVKEGALGENQIFGSIAEAQLAFDIHTLDLQAKVKIRIDGVIKDTTLGRTLFAQTLPEGFEWTEEQVGKKQISKILELMVEKCERVEVAQALDRIKTAGFYWATRSGVSMAISDANFDSEGKFDKERAKMIREGEKEHTKIQESFDLGGITDLERRDELGALWFKRTNEIQELLQSEIPQGNAIRMMVESGARGNWIQVRSVLGMRGPVATSSGDFAPMPVKGNYLVGLTASEYFINATGARKGNADTAMKTSAAGYLTRRLVDVAQDVIVRDPDCDTSRYLEKSLKDVDGNWDDPNIELSIMQRNLAEDVKVDGKVIAKRNDAINIQLVNLLKSADVETVKVRSVFTCDAISGVCAACYGVSLATNEPVELGEAIGIIAAQSIGEPGTQLTMRTFHTGGAAAATTKRTILKSIGGQKVRVERLISYDITQGLTGVTDLLEARPGWRQGKVGVLAFWPGRIELKATAREWVALNRDVTVRELVEIEAKDEKSTKNKIYAQVIVAVDDKDGSKVADTAKAGKAVVVAEAGEVTKVTEEYIEVQVDRTVTPRLEPGINLSDAKLSEIQAENKRTKSQMAKVRYELTAFSNDGNRSKQRVFAKVGDKVVNGQVIADGLLSYPVADAEALPRLKKAKVEAGKVINASELISKFGIVKEVDVFITPSEEGYEEAEKIAQNYAFSRSTSKTFAKLSPKDKIATIPAGDIEAELLVQPGDWVGQGEYVIDGTPNPHAVLSVLGPKWAAYEIIKGVQAIYGSQGVPLHDKHLEVIVRQMLGKVTVIESGETDMLPGEIIDRTRFQSKNREAQKSGQKPASARQEVMGMTRASLAAQSWLSAASFQETTRVLTQAALDRREDKLEGLKENVIIGKLIPAGTGLKGYRAIEVEATEEAKAERYPNRIWDAPVASEGEEFASASLFSADFDDWSESKE